MASTAGNALTAVTSLTASDELTALNVGDNPRRATLATLGKFLASAVLAAGVLTTSAPMTVTQTWNAGGVAFTSLLVNVTDTASAAASLLLDLQVGGSSKFQVNKSGDVALKSVNFSGSAFGTNIDFSNAGFRTGTTGMLSFNDDTIIRRDAANTLAQRNGTAAQAFNLYSTYTDASNYERLGFGFNGASYTIGAQAAGTGSSARNLVLNSGSSAGGIYFNTGNSDRWQLNTSGHFLAVADNAYDIGASGASRPKNVYVAGTVVIGGLTINPANGSVTLGQINQIVIDTSNALVLSHGDGDGVFVKARGAGITPKLFFTNSTNTNYTTLTAEAAEILAQRNGTAAQAFRLYNTYTDGSNYERLVIEAAVSSADIYTANAGTGAARGLRLGTGGTLRWQLNTSGHFLAVADNTYDIGGSGANRPRNGYFGTNVIAGGYVMANGALYAGSGNTVIRGPSTTTMRFLNAAESDAPLVQWGGGTSSFPALKRSSTVLQARLADDTAFAPLQGKLRAEANAVAETPTATHTLLLQDAAGTQYKVLAAAA